MKNKKLFAILTLVCFMFTLMPVAAMASDGSAIDISGAVLSGVDSSNTTASSISSTKELAEAIEAGETELTLEVGTYQMPAAAKGKTLTINGTKDSVIEVVPAGQGEANGQLDYSLDGSTVTFNGVTIKTNSQTYAGYARLSGTYNNCVIQNTYNLGTGNSAFYNCEINITNEYLRVGGASTAVFDGCTFNTDGRAILVFQDGTSVAQTVTVKDCTFNATAAANTWNGIHVAAVSYDGSQGGTYTVNFEGTNKVDTDFNGLWQNKNGEERPTVNTVVDGVCKTTVEGYAVFSDAHTYEENAVEENKVSDATHTAKAVYKKSCACGAVSDETFEYGDTIAHTFDKEIAEAEYLKTAATCENAAVYYKSCVCGVASETETFAFGAEKGHTLVATEAKAATCTEVGNSAYWTCSVCGKYFSDEAGTTEIIENSWVIPAGHTLTAVAKVEPTYSETGMEAHDKCSACGKLFVDGVEKTVEELTIAKLVYSGGGGYVGGTSTPSTSDKTESSTTTETTTPNGTTVKVETETKADGTTVETTTTTTVTGETSTTVTATLDNGSAVTNNDDTVAVEVTKVEETVVNQVEEAVAADENVNVVGTAENAVSVSATNASTGAAQTNFVQPMVVSVPVDNTVLNNVTDTSKLTMAKVVTNEDGTTELVYVGGSYDKESGTFSAKVDQDGDYILVEKADLVKIELTIDDTTVKHNDVHHELDVAPVINAEAGRTELPLRYLGEALGFGIDWNNNVVTISKGDISFSLTIGEEIPGFGTPYIDSDRTMVSARYISEMLGANVIWDPVDRQVIVVK